MIYSMLLLSFIAEAAPGTESPNVIGSNEPVRAATGDDVTLPCHLEPPFDVTSLKVDWTFGTDFVYVYNNMKDDPESQSDTFKSRTSLFHEEMFKGNISLKLTNVTETDAGTYTCYVPRLESQVKRGNVLLVVEKKNKNTEGENNATNPPKDFSSDTIPGIVAGVIVAVIAVVGVVGAVIVFTSKRSSEDRNQPNRPNPESRQEGRPEETPLVVVAKGNKEKPDKDSVSSDDTDDEHTNNHHNSNEHNTNNEKNTDDVDLKHEDNKDGENNDGENNNYGDNTDDVNNDDEDT